MRLLRARALVLFPAAVVFSPKANEGDSGRSLALMGARLAEGVRDFLAAKCPELLAAKPSVADVGDRLSFVAHSAGALVVRVALTSPLLAPALPRLHAFLTLSSPHLGTAFLDSTVVAGGLWALRRLGASPLIDELALADPARAVEALAAAPAFALFRYVVLVAAVQDAYVPAHTALAAVPSSAEGASAAADAYRAMSAALWRPVLAGTRTSVRRLTLDLRFGATSMNTAIGRAAHVSYLDNEAVIDLLLLSLYGTFE